MPRFKSKHVNQQSGYILIAMLTTISFVVVAAVSVASLASNNLRVASSDTYRLAAQLAADAGADISIQQLNAAPTSWSNSSGWQPITSTANYETEYTSELIDGPSDSQKILVVTGRTISPTGSGQVISERSYSIAMRALVAGNFSVVSGVGGLTMRNSSKIIGGSVHVNGKINMSNSAQIGLSSSPVDVSIAHHNCPPGGGASYPSLCGTGSGSPIITENTARIYGDVRANNGSAIPGTTLSQLTNNGLVASSGVVANDLPDHDRSQQISDINAAIASDSTRDMSSSQASCDSNNANQTWKANSKANGDVTVGKNCVITVEGDVWITGRLDLKNSGTLRVANGITTPPVIMIDGQGVEMINSSTFASNSAAVGFRVITYYSEASCSPDCTTVTGQDLYDSSEVITIDISNSSSGPNTEFYARWSAVELSNSGGIGALVGQTVILENSAAVTFGVEVSGISTVNGWVLESYRRNF